MKPDQLERLMHRHSGALRLFAAQWTLGPDDAVQEAFIRLVAQQPSPSNPVAWLYRVVKNVAISMSRSRRRRRTHEQNRAKQHPLFTDQCHQGVDAEELSAALERLDGESRQVVVARIWGGLTFEELAEVLEISTSSAHRRFQQALLTLREELELPCQKTKTTTC